MATSNIIKNITAITAASERYKATFEAFLNHSNRAGTGKSIL